jgi:hypothetical protein
MVLYLTTQAPSFLARLWSPVLPLTPLLPHWSGQGSTLSDRVPYLKPISHARLTDRPDDGGSKHL